MAINSNTLSIGAVVVVTPETLKVPLLLDRWQTGLREERRCEQRILVLATVSLLAVGSTAQEHTIVAVATVKQLCEGVITASSETIFNVGREIPSNDDEWRVVQDSALLLAESGNLLMLGNRARDMDQWMAMAQELVESGVNAVEAAEGRDVDALLKAGDQIVVVCEKCHEPYRDGGRSMPIR